MAESIQYEDAKFARFNDSLDQEGDILIASIAFQPSRILFDMDVESYKNAFEEFQNQEYEELIRGVFELYPTPIAFSFRLSEKGEGADDPIRKLLHLKDTWESIIYILYAIVLGELRSKAIDMTMATCFKTFDTNGNPVYAKFNTDAIIAESMKQRIYAMKGILLCSRNEGLGLKSEQIQDSVLDNLLELQSIRNDLSHHSTPTREQAELELKKVTPILGALWAGLQFLEGCKLYRFDSFSTKFRLENFNGHSLTRNFENLTLDPTKASYVLTLGQEHVFLIWGSECYSLSPFLHVVKEAAGHESYVCFFKSKRDKKYQFEPIKVRKEVAFDTLQTRFETEKDALLKRLVP